MKQVVKEANSQTLAAVVGAITLISVIVALSTGAIGDYPAYLQQWELVAAGEDPWSPSFNGNSVPFNAYGPLHAVLGYVAPLDPLAPKIIFTICSIAAYFVLIIAASRTQKNITKKTILFMAILVPLSPLVIVHTYAYGGNDIVSVALCIMALELRARNMLLLAGVALGLGALMKFYPLLFVPFLCLDHRGVIRLRPLLSAVGVFAAGMMFCYLILDWSVFSAIDGGVTRDPKSVSILRFAQTAAEYSGSDPLRELVDFLIDKNFIMVLGVATIVALWGWLSGTNWRITTLVGVLLIFSVYKVGHTQFFIVWVAIVAWILADGADQPSVDVARAFIPVAIFFSLLAIKSALLSIAYIEYNQYANLFGWLDYLWRTISSVVLWFLIIFCFARARQLIFYSKLRKPDLRF